MVPGVNVGQDSNSRVAKEAALMREAVLFFCFQLYLEGGLKMMI